MIIRIDMALNIFCQCGIWLINKILLQESSEHAPWVNLSKDKRWHSHPSRSGTTDSLQAFFRKLSCPTFLKCPITTRSSHYSRQQPTCTFLQERNQQTEKQKHSNFQSLKLQNNGQWLRFGPVIKKTLESLVNTHAFFQPHILKIGTIFSIFSMMENDLDKARKGTASRWNSSPAFPGPL